MANQTDQTGGGGGGDTAERREARLRDAVEADQARSRDTQNDESDEDELTRAERQIREAAREDQQRSREMEARANAASEADAQASSGVTDAEQQEIDAAFQREIEGFGQGEELGGGQAAEFERTVLEENPGLEPEDIRVDREGDELVARATDSGLERLGANPTRREQREQRATARRRLRGSARAVAADPGRAQGIIENAPEGVRLAVRNTPQAPPDRPTAEERIRGMSLRTVQRRSASAARQRERGLVQTGIRRGVEGFFGSYVGRSGGEVLADRTLRRADSVGDAVGQEVGSVQDRAQTAFYGLPGVPSETEAARVQSQLYGGISDAGGAVLDANRNLETYVEEEGFRTGPGPLAVAPAAPTGINAPARLAGTVNRFRGGSSLRGVDTSLRASNVGAQASRGVAGSGGGATATASENIVSRLLTRDAALIGGGVTGALAATQVNVPEDGDVFSPELPATQENARGEEISVPTDGQFQRQELTAPERPVGERSEFQVTDDPAFGQPELRVTGDESSAGLSVQQLVNMPLEEQLEERRRNQFQEQRRRVPEEMIPDEPVVIGEDPGITEPDVVDERPQRDFSRPARPSEGVIGVDNGSLVDEAEAQEVTEGDAELPFETESLGARTEALPLLTEDQRQRQRERAQATVETDVGTRTPTRTTVGAGLGTLALPQVGSALAADINIGQRVGVRADQLASQQAAVDTGLRYDSLYDTGVTTEAAEYDFGTPGETGLPNRPRRPRFDDERAPLDAEDNPFGTQDSGRPRRTFGYLSETFQGFQRGAFDTPRAPSQEELAALDDSALVDLPTQSILSGDVDVDEVQDFFRLDGVQP